jgi:hypothetical protein
VALVNWSVSELEHFIAQQFQTALFLALSFVATRYFYNVMANFALWAMGRHPQLPNPNPCQVFIELKI